MSVHTLKSWSNGALIGAAVDFIRRFPESLAIVPSRLAGDFLVQSGEGAAGLHRFTLIQLASRLARPAMAKHGIAPISLLGLEAVAARIAYQARTEKKLEYFGPVAALPGFARALARTLGELRLARIAPRELSAAPSNDLAHLLDRYQAELQTRSLADLAAVFELAEQNLAHPAGLPLVALDVRPDTKAAKQFMARLVEQSPEALICSCESTPGISADRALPAIEHLRRYVFSQQPPASRTSEGFEIFSAPGEGLESVEIARRILRLARAGTGFDQIAILLRNPDRYQPMIEDALRRAEIPAWFSKGTSRPDPAGRAFLALLACAAERCSASRFAEYLSFGQVPGSKDARAWVAPKDELLYAPESNPEPNLEAQETEALPAPSAWERLLVDAAVIGGPARWVRRLDGLKREFELRQAPEIEQQRLDSLTRFALPLIERLDGLPRSAPWRDWLKPLGSLAESALRNFEGVLAVLAEFEPMGDVGPVTVEEVAEVLSDRLRFLRAEPPQRRWGRVFVGSIDEARACEFSVVFLPGLAEGLFPQRALEDPLLLDQTREAFADLPLRRHRGTEEERERLHLALAAARDRFIASYPRMDVAEARPRVPSFYALELPRALQGALPKLKDFEDRARESSPARLNWPAPREAEDAIDDTEYDLVTLGEKAHAAARYLMEVNPNLKRSLEARYRRWKPQWTKSDGLVVRDGRALEALAGHRLAARPWSPSALEQFAVCPYKFALHGIFGVRPRNEAAPLEYLDPLTRGALFHEVQCALLGELKAEGLLPVDRERLAAALLAADGTLDRIAAEYEELLAPAIPRVWKSEIEDLRTDLRGWLQQVAQNDTDWEPLHFEFSFGMEQRPGRDPASVKEEAVLDEGVRLRGSIDLVEKHRRNGTLRVTDHKSGKAPDRPPLYVGGGRTLQPILYALAAGKILGGTVESGRLFYATQRGGYQQMGVQVNERARRFLARLIENIDGAIAAGFLPPLPEKDACGFCDYRPVCGPYEERRTGRHKNRSDGRLEGLFEIRSFG